MRSLKFLAAAAMLAACTSASAQFTNAKGGGAVSASESKGWNTVWVQYNPGTWKTDVKGMDDLSFSSFSLGYSHAFGVANTLPLYVEAGVGLQYYWNSEDYGDEDYTETVKTHVLSVKVPVDLTYKFQIANSSVSILPYVGLNLRYNLSGKMKSEYSEDDDEDYYAPKRASYSYDDEDEESDELDLFDKKDMGKDEVWKRFQIGWHVGVKAQFGKNFMAGVGYGSDFSEITKKVKSGEWTIQLGYTF